MPLFDTHVHLQDFNMSPQQVVDNMRQHNIGGCICVSAKESDWENVAKIADEFPDFVIPAFAIHPWYAKEVSTGWENRLEKYLTLYPQALVGECGLDRIKNKDLRTQQEVFNAQIKLAKQYNRALLIHAVKAQEWLQTMWQELPNKRVFHSFNGKPEFLTQIINSGAYVALNNKIFTNKNYQTIIRSIPQNRLLLESDAPYQSDFGQLADLCRKIATIRQETLEELMETVYASSLGLVER